jgi:hypothetical protein
MSTLAQRVALTTHTSVDRLIAGATQRFNLWDPRVQRVVGLREVVTFWVINRHSQTAVYDVTINDAGSPRNNVIRVGEMPVNPDGNFGRAEVKHIRDIDLPVGTTLKVILGPQECIAIQAVYDWAGGSADPQVVLTAPAGAHVDEVAIANPATAPAPSTPVPWFTP